MEKRIGEFELIDRLSNRLNKLSSKKIIGIGDDCAVIPYSRTEYKLLTVDVQVENRHFLKTMAPADIGKRAVVVAVSDIAAMGGKPEYILVSLVLLSNTKSDYMDKIYDGISTACKIYGTDVIGGNISTGRQMIIDIFVIGRVLKKNLITRSGAKTGDKILVTGTLGDANLGRQILKGAKHDFNNVGSDYLISRFVNPTARVKVVEVMANTGYLTSMIDLSDGLSSDIGHICVSSHVGCLIYEDKLPVSPQAMNFIKIKKLSKTEIALNGGEDYELLFSVKPNYIDRLKALVKSKTNTVLTEIGEITEKSTGMKLIKKSGQKQKLIAKGWDHLKK
ncbi:thiamine-phosphate kinase [Candidatus Roizmanbacteria bacterium RIFCSPLOWO2_02_FULL_38_10]|uniref:Thiamine-monophosphate kinase n=1 Tax=Candidatus Roizmanbacteria bacterium RIFCSPLOWO2_02_FULL_38_10 TaxID=1802074 RepID=A0A1F7JJM9_9BACT|nr:MAG: thiamine-phosphate kinase [Candidatus Roizmanbacteria bacterium RIFCSPLOWO2_02_FULL_38_10]